jgi:ADP-ribose pyrophosphatase YjhB (NUDIX family)
LVLNLPKVEEGLLAFGKEELAMIVRSIMQGWFRLTRSMTVGVRGMIIDESGKILLIRPSYPSVLWLLPGGGLERGETAREALARELEEEAAIKVRGVPKLFGFYSQEKEFRGDHVILYVVREFELGTFAPTIEIREAGFFDQKNLPAGTSQGTRRRIEEVVCDRQPAEHW